MAADRSFTVEAIYKAGGAKSRISGGRYISSTPSGAAKKAFSKAVKNTKNVKSLELHIRETTSGSKHKTYKYRVSRKKENKEVERGGETITYKYTVKAKTI